MYRIILLAFLVFNLPIIGFAVKFQRYELKCRLILENNVFQLGEPVKVTVFVENVSKNEARLHLSKHFFYNIEFRIRNLKGDMVIAKPFFTYERESRFSETEYKVVPLSKDEAFARTIDISKFFKLDSPGGYVVQAIFYPVPKNIYPDVPGIPSQKVLIKIKPYGIVVTQAVLKTSREAKIALMPKEPEDVVRIFIDAKRERNKYMFLKFVDIRELIKQYPTYYKRYKALPPSKRQVVIKDFKNFLFNYGLEERLVGYDIYKIVKMKHKAQVYVMKSFRYKKVSFKRKYTYYLKRRRDKWYIYRIKVQNV